MRQVWLPRSCHAGWRDGRHDYKEVEVCEAPQLSCPQLLGAPGQAPGMK